MREKICERGYWPNAGAQFRNCETESESVKKITTPDEGFRSGGKKIMYKRVQTSKKRVDSVVKKKWGGGDKSQKISWWWIRVWRESESEREKEMSK